MPGAGARKARGTRWGCHQAGRRLQDSSVKPCVAAAHMAADEAGGAAGRKRGTWDWVQQTLASGAGGCKRDTWDRVRQTRLAGQETARGDLGLGVADSGWRGRRPQEGT